jgi:hypothetical protein
MQQPIVGVPLGAWQRFPRIVSDSFSENKAAQLAPSDRNELRHDDQPVAESKAAFANFVEAVDLLTAATNRNE